MKDEDLRKVVHATAPLFALYYAVPLRGSVKLSFFLSLVVLSILFELLRISRGIRVPGLRDYEARRPAAYSQFMLAALLIFAFLGWKPALFAFASLSIVDPICSHFRGTPFYPWIPFLSLLPVGLALAYMGTGDLLRALLASTVTSAAAVVIESVETVFLDDDLLIPLTTAFVFEALV